MALPLQVHPGATQSVRQQGALNAASISRSHC